MHFSVHTSFLGIIVLSILSSASGSPITIDGLRAGSQNNPPLEQHLSISPPAPSLITDTPKIVKRATTSKPTILDRISAAKDSIGRTVNTYKNGIANVREANTKLEKLSRGASYHRAGFKKLTQKAKTTSLTTYEKGLLAHHKAGLSIEVKQSSEVLKTLETHLLPEDSQSLSAPAPPTIPERVLMKGVRIPKALRPLRKVSDVLTRFQTDDPM